MRRASLAAMMIRSFPYDFIGDALHLPVAAITYELGRRIQALRPGKFVLQSSSSNFDFSDFVAENEAPAAEMSDVRAQLSVSYCETHRKLERTIDNAVYEVQYAGETIEVVVISYSADDVCETRYYLIGDAREAVEKLFVHVCSRKNRVTNEVLVFENNSFEKDERLSAVIQAARLDSLILKSSLKEDITSDVTSFFKRKSLYAKYGVPHKRGLLFYGPPGNGKTHLLKGVIRLVDKPSIYVKSLQSSRSGSHEGLRRIFERARTIAPCVVVFEDLETIVTDENRSFFLNELDGFQENTGLLVLATTNFPERIDPAIVDRPSRFDRKYFLDLPGEEERARFIARFSDSLLSEMQLDSRGVRRVAEATRGFSFAYLKELTLSALMVFIEAGTSGSMADILEKQATSMQDQVRRGKAPAKADGKRVGLIPEA